MTQTLRLLQGDCIERMHAMPDASVSAAILDPPYGLEFQNMEWDKLGVPQSWQFGGGFSKPGIGDRHTAWPSFSGNTPFGSANPTCAECGGRLRGAKRCSCPQPHTHWKPLGSPRKQKLSTGGAGFTAGGSDRFKSSHLPSFNGTPNPVCQTCGGTQRGNDRKGFRRCTCEEPDFPNIRLQQSVAMGEWHKQWLQEVYRVLQPGGVIKVFSATRTNHRLAAAMEAVGFTLDPFEGWGYASGFPKDHNLSKAIDKLQGVDPEVEPEIQAYLRQCREAKGLSKSEVDRLVFGGTTRYSWVEGRGGDRSDEVYLPTPDEWLCLKEVLSLDARYDAYIQAAIPARSDRFRADGGKADVVATIDGDWGYQRDGERWDGTYRVTEASSPEAKQFVGYGTALKPAWEIFLVGRKPVGDH